jgi:UDP-glucose:(heptosyl)LPS alpha-1,3-glucosyltransferase
VKIAVNIEAVGSRFGGAENYAASLVRWLASAGHQVHVVSRQVEAAELPTGTRVHRVCLSTWPGLGWLRSYRFARESELLLRREPFDLIIGLAKVWHQDVAIAVSGSHPASLAYNSLRFRGPLRRMLWWATKLASPKQWVFKVIERRQFGPGRQPHVIVPAQMVAEHFQQYHGVPPARISVVPWGLDTARELTDRASARAAFRHEHKFGEQDVVVLFVARNYQLKGLGQLLVAFAPLARRYPHLRLLACGGKHEAAHRRQARRLGLAGQVRFLGFVDDIRHCFAASDVFAFPTFYDPCSLVVLEAMRAGLPVVTTRANGAAELITEGSEGFVIDSPWDIDDLRLRLELLATNGALRERMSLRARAAAERFSLVDRAGQLLTVLEHAAAASPTRPAARIAA